LPGLVLRVVGTELYQIWGGCRPTMGAMYPFRSRSQRDITTAKIAKSSITHRRIVRFCSDLLQTDHVTANYVDNLALLYFSAEPQPRAAAARSAAVGPFLHVNAVPVSRRIVMFKRDDVNVNVNMRFIVPPLLKEHGCIT